jgi:hypothetical protein
MQKRSRSECRPAADGAESYRIETAECGLDLNRLWKKSALSSIRGMTAPESEVFPQELARAKPVALDDSAVQPFFNGLLTMIDNGVRQR